MFLQEPFQVMVVHETHIHLTVGGGQNYGDVVGVISGVVVLHTLQPLPGCVIALR